MKSEHSAILIELLKTALQQTQSALKAEPVDWARLFQLAQSHSIANTLYYAVKELPTEISEPFRLEWLRSVQIDTVQKLETDNFLKLLNAEQIRCVPLKGYVLKSLYPSPEMRSMGDIDILIDAKNMPRVTEIMIKAGFIPDSNQGGGNHYSFNKKPCTHIEFHHSLFDMSSPFSKYFNPGWQYVASQIPPVQPSNLQPVQQFNCPTNQLTNTVATERSSCPTQGHSPCTIANHWQAAPYNSLYPVLLGLTNKPTNQQDYLSNIPTFQLSHEGFYIFMLGHMANHFIFGGTGIRSVMDVWVYNQHYEQQLDWAFINSEFERAGLLQFAQNIKNLSDVWFGNKASTELLDEMGDYIIGSGTYGTTYQAALSEVLKNDDQNALGFRKVKAFAKRVFLPLKEMQYRYAFLKELPFLLPVGWFLRGIRVLKTRKVILQSWLTNVSSVNQERFEEHKHMFKRFGLRQ